MRIGKIAKLFLVLTIAASTCLSGCGGGNPTNEEPQMSEHTNEPATEPVSEAATTEAATEAPTEEPTTEPEPPRKPVIGISWSTHSTQNEDVIEKYKNFSIIVEAAGGVAVNLGQVTSQAVEYDENNKILSKYVEKVGDSRILKQEYADQIKARKYEETNVEEVMEGVDGVIFIGGGDFSPTLFKEPVPLGKNVERIIVDRDISDYLLMAYCIDMDIPTLGICRGEQIMGIVCGCSMIQDLPTYYAANGVKDYKESRENSHRMAPGSKDRDFTRHSVDVLEGSKWLGSIIGAPSLENVSSWHHQNIDSVEGTDLTVVATATVKDITIVEGIELQDKKFCLGLQFHPENDLFLAMCEDKTEEALCDLDVCMGFFEKLVESAR